MEENQNVQQQEQGAKQKNKIFSLSFIFLLVAVACIALKPVFSPTSYFAEGSVLAGSNLAFAILLYAAAIVFAILGFVKRNDGMEFVKHFAILVLIFVASAALSWMFNYISGSLTLAMFDNDGNIYNVIKTTFSSTSSLIYVCRSVAYLLFGIIALVKGGKSRDYATIGIGLLMVYRGALYIFN